MTSGRSSLGEGARSGGARSRELALRIGSGAVLAAVALGLTVYGLWSFTGFIVSWGMVMCWEWGRLVRGRASDVVLGLHGLAIVAPALLLASGYGVAAIAVTVLGVLAVLVMRAGSGDRLSALGVAYVGLPILALIWFRSDPGWGWPAVLFVFAVVWSTDIAAYAFGRLIGGAKLVPRISPNKTWAGFLGGAGSGALAGGLSATVIGGTSPVSLALVALALSLIAQLGDLSESVLKRSFGFKDSSGLIPGHGGLLDRVDGLVLAAQFAALIALIKDPAHPGAALLIWGS